MKFRIYTSEMDSGLSMVTKAVAAKPVKPAYECVLIESNPEGLLLTCTDGEMTIKTQIASTVQEDGQVLLPAKLFSDLMHKQTGDEAGVSIDQRCRATISAGGSKTNIVGMDTEDFPQIVEISSGNQMTLPAGRLKNAISHVMFAVSNDESHKVLTGVLMEFGRDRTNLVGLDGYRLSLQSIEAENTIPQDKEYLSVIIPGRVMNELSRMLPDSEEKPVTITFNQTHAMISFEQVQVFTALLTGEYIDYRHVIPAESKIILDVAKAPFIAALERCGLMARAGKSKLITLDVSDYQIRMSSRAERGDVEETLETPNTCDPLRISFNSDYLMDVFRNVEGSNMRLCMSTSVSPCLVLPEEEGSFKYLVLPVRTME